MCLGLPRSSCVIALFSLIIGLYSRKPYAGQAACVFCSYFCCLLFFCVAGKILLKDCKLSWLCGMGISAGSTWSLESTWIPHLSQSGLPSLDASIPLALLQGKVNPSSTPHILYLCFIFPTLWWLPVLTLHFFHAPHVVGRQMGILTERMCNGWCGFRSCIKWRKLESLNFLPLVSPSSTFMPPTHA